MFPKVKKIAFIAEFYHKARTLAETCQQLVFVETTEATPEPIPLKALPPAQNTMYSIANVPSYLRLSGIDEQRYSLKRYGSLKNFTIDMSGDTDIESYMRRQFSKKARGNVMRPIRRLEKCYDLQNTRYWGAIEEAVCSRYLAMLKDMIINRFNERGDDSDTLKIWDQISSTLYSMILSKKASMYVVEADNKPIAISVGYHYPGIFFYYITSYDTDYAKFSLGHYILFKQLEWCFHNAAYRYFEMGWGDLEYKRRWSNRINNLDHFFLVPRKNIPARLLAFALGNKTRIKAYLLEKKVNLVYKKLIGVFHHQEPVTNDQYRLETCDAGVRSTLQPLDLGKPENARFRGIRNDFIYHSEENAVHVNVFKDTESGEFYILGKSTGKKIVFAEAR